MLCQSSSCLKGLSADILSTKGKPRTRKKECAAREHEFKRFFEIQKFLLR